ncbi:hypothetical protein M2118_000243 [Aurantimicrobium minutum]|uniref:DUF6264 family protein n=1 Tax=Aurantimicrobium minutum TaxID=708131 RepID=UPI0024741F25|nr:DUF6264 family protein [Aurantimicrobium minutum]MDH6277292.1 hypothetical protein [Aurantimicrobium minutum]
MAETPETTPASDKEDKATSVSPAAKNKNDNNESKQAPTPLTPEEKKERSLALDRFITWGLIFVAVFSVFSGLGDYINPRASMNLLYDELNTLNPDFNLGTFENITFAVQMGWVAVTIQAIVLAMVVWVSRQRMKAKKFSWWIPVLGAVISNALSTACIFIALFSDPGFQEGINSLINAGK